MDPKTSIPLTSEQQMNAFRFRDKMTLLNSEFLVVLNRFQQDKPSCDLTATLKSYMDHVTELREMYKMVSPSQNGNKSASAEVPKPAKQAVQVQHSEPRKIAKAHRKNTQNENVLNGNSEKRSFPATPAPSIFASSSPAVQTGIPKFGDISMIPKETPVAIEKTKTTEESAQPAPRKRAIRGGGPLGGSESVIFKSGKDGENGSSAPEIKIPEMKIKFPEPTKDFWTKKTSSSENDKTSDAPNNGGSLFAFLGNSDASATTPKFTGFSFGKKDDDKDSQKSATTTAESPKLSSEKKEDEKKSLSLFGNSALSTSPFGSKKDSEKSSTLSFPSFGKPEASGSENKKDSSSTPLTASFPSFGSAVEKKVDAPKSTLAFPSFGGSTSGSAGSLFAQSSKPGLSFGSGGSLFANLNKQAAENSAKAEGEGNDEDGEYVPPKVEAVENEEPGAVFSKKVSVFKYNGKEYQKLGVGMLHIKEADGKNSVLIRAATTTGTVWLNAVCNSAMKATKVDDKGDKYRLTCPITASEMGTFLIRFGVADVASQFADKIAELAK